MPTNCWEHKKCGRQRGGVNAFELGICPAAHDTRFRGINDGSNGGRICWAVVGTLCGGVIQGTFAEKYKNCKTCTFFIKVGEEQGETYRLMPQINTK